MKLTTPLDANRNELRQVRSENLATAPSTPVVGQRYFDTALKVERVWDGTKWTDLTDVWVGPSAPAGTPATGDLWYDTDDVSTLVLPLTIADGGTGAADATSARANLGVPTFPLSVANGGTGAATAAAARTSLAMPGEELAYNQITASVSLTSLNAASPNLVIEGSPRSYDGSPVMIEVSAILSCPAATGGAAFLNLWDGSTDLGVICEVYNGAGNLNYAATINGKRRLVPSVGSHNYRILGWVNAGVGSVYTSPGGAGLNQLPAFLQVSRV